MLDIIKPMNESLEFSGRPITNWRQQKYLEWYIQADINEWKAITLLHKFIADDMLQWLQCGDDILFVTHELQ
jgi:hypothetical protein